MLLEPDLTSHRDTGLELLESAQVAGRDEGRAQRGARMQLGLNTRESLSDLDRLVCGLDAFGGLAAICQRDRLDVVSPGELGSRRQALQDLHCLEHRLLGFGSARREPVVPR